MSTLLQRKQQRRWEQWGQFCYCIGLLRYMLTRTKHADQQAYIRMAIDNLKAALAITIKGTFP